MTSCADLRILFRAPAGARRGFGHLVRCRSLARALGVRPLISLRGGTAVQDHIAVAQDRIKIVVASGGNTKSGTFTVILG